ncbi:MAG TPA: hypothetical protein VH683_06815 [Thermoleophilaceae bacterium]
MDANRAQIRRFAGRALVGGLSVAAAVAVLAVLVGSFGETETRVILSSIGFAVASATGSAGASARLRPSERLRLLGTATMLTSGVGFALLLIVLWSPDYGSEGIARAFGCVAVAGLGMAHACAMLGARRRGDSPAVQRLTKASVTLGAIDTVAVILPMAALVDDVNEVVGRLFGATIVLLVFTTMLPTILRRTQAVPIAAAASNGKAAAGDEFLASAVVQIADRIDLLNSDPGNRAPEISAEVERLRKLAQSFEN